MPSHSAPKTNNPSHLKDLILLFSLPAALAIITALAVYVPRFLAHPKYDFIYAYCSEYRCKDSYSVNADGVISHDTATDDMSAYEQSANLRYYDASSDSTRSLTLEEAKRYRLDASSKSPDKYTLAKESSDSGFLFWSDQHEGWYLKNGAKKKKVELTNDSSYYASDITFLGWVGK